MTLEEYCQENIFKPLGMTSTTFRLLNHPYAASNLMKMHARNKEGKVELAESIYPIDPKIDMGSSNLYTSAPDFMKLLTSLMRSDGKLLHPETVDIMFNYRLPDTENFNSFKRAAEEIQYFFGDTAPDGMKIDHCLAGMVVLDSLRGGRKAGSVSWGGATSCFWVELPRYFCEMRLTNRQWIDRVTGICGFYGSQSMLMGDQQISTGFFRKFEQAIYATYGGET
jgi:CubicO group peptidase (beta-lactamase class C family)